MALHSSLTRAAGYQLLTRKVVDVLFENGKSLKIGGDEGDRTPDLCNAIAALSQLSYGPEPFPPGLVRASAAFRQGGGASQGR